MLLQTARFGELKISEQDIYTFPQGLPGFERYRQYVLLETEEGIIEFLQSIEEPSISLMLVDPFLYYPDYDFALPDNVVEELGVSSPEQIFVRSVLNLPGDIHRATINLVAPVVFHAERKRGRQVILTQTQYTTKHPLFPNLAASGTEKR